MVAAAMPGQVEYEAEHQEKPFVTRDAPRENKDIHQGGARQENAAQQCPDPGREGKAAWQDPFRKGKLEERRIRQEPDQNGDP